MKSFVKKYYFQIILIFLVIIYLFTRFFHLTYLPVFADESIYIRWSQLIISDAKQYFFFPMNDGKTPLQMWLTVPLLLIFKDPLWAARLLSVVVGLIQIWVMMVMIKSLGGKKSTQLVTAFLVVILPGWFFYERMALIDSLLTLFLSLTFLFTYKSIKCIQKQFATTNRSLKQQAKTILNKNTWWAGLFFGLSFWTKFSALTFLPVLAISALFVFDQKKKGKQSLTLNNWLQILGMIAMVVLMGMAIFFMLRISPVFSQIFARGGDFLYSFSDFFNGNPIKIITTNIFDFVSYLANNMYWLLLLFTAMVSIWQLKKNRQPLLLLICALAFLLPMMVLGKVVYPRYLMPALFFLTIAAALCINIMWQSKKLLSKILVIIVVFFTTIYGGYFMYTSYFDLAKLPLVKDDSIQYLEEWSSGFGIPESVAYIEQLSKNEKVLVMTEGYFGTLPDALLMYFFNKDVENLRIEGIGWPIKDIPEEKIAIFDNFDKIILVVNSHRMEIKLPEENLLQEYLRPAPIEDPISLQIWEIDKSYGTDE